MRRLRSELNVDLSPRESQLLEFAASGMTDQAIANQIGISLATIATYWGRIRIKFGPLSRTEIVALHLKSISQREIDTIKSENEILRTELTEKFGNESVLIQALNLLQDAVVIYEIDSTIFYVNKIVCELTGYVPSEMIGKRMEDFYAEDRIELLKAWYEKLINEKDNPDLRLDQVGYFRAKDGATLVFNANFSFMTVGGKDYAVCAGRFEPN